MTAEESIAQVEEIQAQNFSVGDYVFACRFSDAGPDDPWRVGIVEKVVKTDYGYFSLVLRNDAHRYRYARKLRREEGEKILYDYGDETAKSEVAELRNWRQRRPGEATPDNSPPLRLSTGSCGKRRLLDDSVANSEEEIEEIVVNEFKRARLKDCKLRKCGKLLDVLDKCRKCLEDAISDVQSVRGFNSVKIYMEDVVDFATRAEEIMKRLEETEPIFKQ